MTTIRQAERSDAGSVAQLLEKIFRATFGFTNTPEDMGHHCRNSFGESIQAKEITAPNETTLLSEDEGQLVGVSQLRWGNAPECVPGHDPGEIHRIYVLPDHHGTGVARELMTTSIEAIKKRKSEAVWLGVWQQNARAIAFYKKLGFAEVGRRQFQLGQMRHNDFIMALSIKSTD